MRLLRSLFIILALVVLLPGTVLAAPQEQVVKQEIRVVTFDIWQHTDGRWQDTDKCGEPDYYGWMGKTFTETYNFPKSEWEGKYQLTRVEVDYPFTERQYNNCGRPESWNDFKKDVDLKKPANYSVAKTGENLVDGQVTVKRTMDLEPELLDLKDPTVREQLGMDEKSFSNMAQGWRWYLPVLITWYGVPKQAVQPPDFSVTLDRYEFKDMNPGDRITITAVYKLNESHTQNEKAILKAFHEVNGTQYPVTLEPVDPANQLNNHIIEFSPGETKQYKVKVTAQDTSSKIITKVWPAEAANDADWSNNSDEALIQVEAPCTDISVTLINPFKYDGESGVVPLDAIIRRAHDGPDGPVTVKVRLRGVGVLTGPEFTKTLKQGQSQTIRYTVDLPVNPQKYTYTGTVEPIGVEDCRPSNNRDTYTFTVTPPPVIPKTTSGIDAGITGGGGFR